MKMKLNTEESSKISEIFNSLKSRYADVEKSDCFISSLERIYREARDKQDKECTAASLYDVIDRSLLDRVLHVFCVNPFNNRWDGISSATVFTGAKTIAEAIIRNDVSYLNELDLACQCYCDALEEADDDEKEYFGLRLQGILKK